MPFNFDTYGVTDATDPYQNIMAGVEHLRRYIDMFDGNVKLGLAAYNAGPGNVKKYGGVPPFKETQDVLFPAILFHSSIASEYGSTSQLLLNLKIVPHFLHFKSNVIISNVRFSERMFDRI